MDDLGWSFYQSTKEKHVVNNWKWIKNPNGVNLKSKIWNKIKNCCSFENIARTYKYGSLCCLTAIIIKWY